MEILLITFHGRRDRRKATIAVSTFARATAPSIRFLRFLRQALGSFFLHAVCSGHWPGDKTQGRMHAKCVSVNENVLNDSFCSALRGCLEDDWTKRSLFFPFPCSQAIPPQFETTACSTWSFLLYGVSCCDPLRLPSADVWALNVVNVSTLFYRAGAVFVGTEHCKEPGGPPSLSFCLYLPVLPLFTYFFVFFSFNATRPPGRARWAIRQQAHAPGPQG